MSFHEIQSDLEYVLNYISMEYTLSKVRHDECINVMHLRAFYLDQPTVCYWLSYDSKTLLEKLRLVWKNLT